MQTLIWTWVIRLCRRYTFPLSHLTIYAGDSLPVGQDPFEHLTSLSQGSLIIYPAYQIFALWLVARLQLWSSNEDNYMVGAHHNMKNCTRETEKTDLDLKSNRIKTLAKPLQSLYPTSTPSILLLYSWKLPFYARSPLPIHKVQTSWSTEDLGHLSTALCFCMSSHHSSSAAPKPLAFVWHRRPHSYSWCVF